MSLEPQSKDGTNSSNLWMCFQVTMGSNNIANILQRHYSACNENFLLYIFMLKSVRHLLGVCDKVWGKKTQFTLFLFIRLLFFPAQWYSCWIFLLFYRFEAENILVLFLNFLNVVSILACIGSPFITLLLAFSILTYYSLTILTGTQFTPIKTVGGEP